MFPEIRIIHQLSRNEIFENKKSVQADLKAWIANQNYYLSAPLQNSGGSKASEFSLLFRSSEELFASLTYDFNRFSQSSIETMYLLNQSRVLPKSSAWTVVQLYYSAFYAAHALLRLFGRSCTQLEAAHSSKIYDIAVATNTDNSIIGIESGFYYSIISGSNIEYKKFKDSHADTWRAFHILLTFLINEIPNTSGLSKHKSDAMSLISELKSTITRSNSNRGNWLSLVRNKVNYQHTHGTWFPYQGAHHDSSIIFRKDSWKNPPVFFTSPNRNDDISIFNSSCNLIISLLYHILSYGYERSGEKSIILKNGVFRLINQIEGS